MVTTTDRKYQPQELTTIVEGTCYRSFKPFHLTTTITNQQSLSYPAINVRKQSGTHGQCYGVTDRTVVLRNSDPSSAAQQPDIDWIPNYQKYRARCLQRLKRGGLEPELPIGYPQKVDSRLVWSGQELRHKENEYIIKLSMEEIDEIEEAVSCFSSMKLPMAELSRETFHLPKLGPRLIEVSRNLYLGCGFIVVRGLEPEKYSAEENVIIFAGVASYIAEIRGRQDEDGNVLLHLTDLGSEVAPDNLRQAPYSNVAQPYHTDLGEVIGLYALQQAIQGGRSKLASTGTIYNELAKYRPDHIHTLQRPDWVFDRFGQDPTYIRRPILFRDSQTDNITLAFSRRQLTGSKVSPRSANIPPMTEAQAEALDAVHFTAEKHCIALDCKSGDMQFWNNLAILHSREGFTDEKRSDNKEPQKRHLLRLWLRNNENPWRSPWAIIDQVNEVYRIEDANGRPAVKEKWPIHPIRNFDHVTTRKRASGHG